MAAGGPVRDLCDEATCAICLEFFTDPVTIAGCGHNFCRACLAQCWGEGAGDSAASCPQCRGIVPQRTFLSNRQQAKFVEIAQKLSLQGGIGAQGKAERVCAKHQEPLARFCTHDLTLACVICSRTEEHREHRVLPLAEAGQKYRDKLCRCLKTLRQGRETILTCKDDAEKESQDLLRRTDAEREKAVMEFRRLHRFLEDQEMLLLAQMATMEEEIATRRDDLLASLSTELASFDSIIREMEEKCQQSEFELLEDIESTLKRCKGKEAFEKPPTVFPAQAWRIWQFCDVTPFLEGIREKFQDALFGGGLQRANVTLDPATSHPNLILS